MAESVHEKLDQIRKCLDLVVSGMGQLDQKFEGLSARFRNLETAFNMNNCKVGTSSPNEKDESEIFKGASETKTESPEKDCNGLKNGATDLKNTSAATGNLKLTISQQQAPKNEIKTKSSWTQTETESESNPLKQKDDEPTAEMIKEDRIVFEILQSTESILDKVAPHNFTPMMRKFKCLPINNERRLKEVILLIFRKAIEKPDSCEAYANMCRVMSQYRVSVPGEKANQASETNDQPKELVFRKLILTCCQREFEKNLTGDDDLKQLRKKIEEAKTKKEKSTLKQNLSFLESERCKRELGNIRFIGELFKLSMLTEPIMHNCIMALFRARKEESLQSLCVLLTTIGCGLDHVKGKHLMNQYFSQFDKILAGKMLISVTSRTKYMILDLKSLRKNNWVPTTLKSQRSNTTRTKKLKQQHHGPRLQKPSALLGNSSRIVREVRISADKKKLMDDDCDDVKDDHRDEQTFNDSPASHDVKELKVPEKTEEQTGFSSSEEENCPIRNTSRQIVSKVDDAISRKINSIVAEYLHLQDIREATECFEELRLSPKLGHVIVKACLEESLEKMAKDRINISRLLSSLVKNDKIQPDQYIKGVSSIMKLAVNLELDLPKVWTCIAELVSGTLHTSAGQIGLDSLKEIASPLLEFQKADIFLAEILKQLIKEQTDVNKVLQDWRNSNLQMEYFMQNNNPSSISAFLDKHELRPFYGAAELPPTSDSMTSSRLNLNDLVKQITKQLDMHSPNDPIFDWVESTTSPLERSEPVFLRALVTAVCNKAIVQGTDQPEVNKKLVTSRSNLLRQFLDTEEKELLAVYALQRLFVDLEQPPNVLKHLFDLLYDEEVISEQTFFKWEKSEDSNELEGKGVALLSVNHFFTWLRHAEVESDE